MQLNVKMTECDEEPVYAKKTKALPSFFFTHLGDIETLEEKENNDMLLLKPLTLKSGFFPFCLNENVSSKNTAAPVVTDDSVTATKLLKNPANSISGCDVSSCCLRVTDCSVVFSNSLHICTAVETS